MSENEPQDLVFSVDTSQVDCPVLREVQRGLDVILAKIQARGVLTITPPGPPAAEERPSP